MKKNTNSSWKISERSDLQDFFEQATQGEHQPAQELLPQHGPQDPQVQPIMQEYQNHAGQFDKHIETSIPDFRKNFAYKVQAILNLYKVGGAKVLDIAASEGSFGKTLSAMSNGKIETTSLDPNPAMHQFFETQSQVPGAKYDTRAFGQGFVDNHGNQIEGYSPAGEYDVVHESMAFQFIGPEREEHIREAKAHLKPDGLFLTEEKVITPEFDQNEQYKDDNFKPHYFNQQQLQQKQELVRFQHVAGMMDNMVPHDEFEKLLQQNFKSVAQYWDAGNFKGYACSDNPTVVQNFLAYMKSEPSEFQTQPMPRQVSSSWKTSDWDWDEDFSWDDPNPDFKDELRDKLFPADESQPSPKFYEGDSVQDLAYGQNGTIKGEPFWSEGQWNYYVDTYDSQGPVGLLAYRESDLTRPSRYDQPGEMTIKDMFGIPPEGEEYFRQAANWDEVLQGKAGKGEFAPGKEAIITWAGPEHEGQVARGDAVTLVSESVPGHQWIIRTKSGEELSYPRMRMFVPPQFLDVSEDLWPDTIPWSEGEQEYYRTAASPWDFSPGDRVIIKRFGPTSLDPRDYSGELATIESITAPQPDDLSGRVCLVRLDDGSELNVHWSYLELVDVGDVVPWSDEEQEYYRTAAPYEFEHDRQFGMGIKREKTYGMIWTEDQPVQEVTFKGIKTVYGEPYTATFWYGNDYRKPVNVMYDHFKWMVENNMIFPLDRQDTLDYLPWSDEEQDYYRTSAETPNQRLRAWQELDLTQGPDTAKIVYQFPDGWTVRNLQTVGDKHREGVMQRNCWQTNGPLYDPQGNPRPIKTFPGMDGMSYYFSLRDPDNLPVASFFVYPSRAEGDNPGIYDILGPRNKALNMQDVPRIHEFADAMGYRIADMVFPARTSQRVSELVQFPMGGQQYDRDAGPITILTVKDGQILYTDEWGKNQYILPTNQFQDFIRNGIWTRISGWTSTRLSDIVNPMDSVGVLKNLVAQDAAASVATQALSTAGGQVYVVGGAVRDAVLGKNPKDIDLMCSGLTGDQIEAALAPLGRLDFTGKQFGVYRFKRDGSEVEIALPRTEQSTGMGHKDFEITTDPHLDPTADLARRDFTGNAMAYNPISGELLDPHNGAQDLQNGNLRLVNDKAFEDDPLRIVRALVANARFGLQPDENLIQSMKDNAQAIRHLPGERIQMEMDKLLSSSNPVSAMTLAEQTGLLDYIAPELSASVGFDQHNPYHDLNVWDHTMKVLQKMSSLSSDPDLRMAALFHDSGKPDSFWQDETVENGGGHFYKKVYDDGTSVGQDHQDVSADLVRSYMERLRYPKARIERVVNLVQNHMFPYFDSKKGARKFLNSLDGDIKTAFDLLLLRQSDASGKREGEMNDYDSTKVDQARQLLQEVLEEGNAVSVKDLAINGRDLIQRGMKPGPEIGQTLDRLLQVVLENPELNTKDILLNYV